MLKSAGSMKKGLLKISSSFFEWRQSFVKTKCKANFSLIKKKKKKLYNNKTAPRMFRKYINRIIIKGNNNSNIPLILENVKIYFENVSNVTQGQ
jgi:hypothetical protein